MVNSNLTLLVELVLFLLFLGGMGKFIIMPTVRLLDARARKIREDHESAQEKNQQADGLEQRYQSELRSAKHKAHDEIREAYREESRKHIAALVERRREADQQIQEVRAEAMQEVAQQRDTYKELVPGVVQAITKQLGLRGGAR